MGLLNIFKKNDPEATVRKHAQRVANKRAQSPDRWESIRVLSELGTPEAIEALLVRFTFTTDPSITDQEEKDSVCEAVVGAGEMAVAPVRRFLGRAESLGWPLKLLEQLLTPEQVIDELLALLATMDTEYERDPQRKLQVLADLEERRSPRIADAALPFLEDVNESARFHAVGAIMAQDNADAYRESLTELLLAEESMRVRARILDGFAEHEWSLKPHAKQLQLPSGYRLDGKGVPRRS